MSETIEMVNCDAIRVSPFQPRRHFAEEDLQDLARSIDAVGLIHPPVVRKIESQGKLLYYELIAGERRWRATQLAGFKNLPVIVRTSSDTDAARATLIENVQRVDLDPIETALAYQNLIKAFRLTQEEVADRVGKKRSTVANYLRVLALPDAVKTALSSGKITLGHAKAILALDSPELQKKLTDQIVKEKMTVREAEKAGTKLEKTPDPHIADLQEKLQQHLGTKVQIEHRKNGSGKVTLNYYSLDDLERLLTVLN